MPSQNLLEMPTEPQVPAVEHTLVIARVGEVGVEDTLRRFQRTAVRNATRHTEEHDSSVAEEAEVFQVNDVVRPHRGLAESLQTKAEGIRRAFVDLTQPQRTLLEPYLVRCADRVFGQNDERPRPKAIASWSEWLATDSTASDLLAFANAHAAELEEKANNPAVAEAFVTEKNSYIWAIGSGVAAGWFSPALLTKVKTLQSVRMRLGDLWDTTLRDTAAYWMLNRSQVVIGTGVVGAGEEARPILVAAVKENTKHELDHTVNGKHMPAVFKEALAEHIVQSIDDGQFDVINPDDRRKDTKVYAGFRKLVHRLSVEGDESIPVSVWTRAHTSAGRDSKEYKEFADMFIQAWHTTPERVGKAVVAYRELLMADSGKTETEIETIASEHVMQDLLKDRSERLAASVKSHKGVSLIGLAKATVGRRRPKGRHAA